MLDGSDHDLLIRIQTQLEERKQQVEAVAADLRLRTQSVDHRLEELSKGLNRLEKQIEALPELNGRNHLLHTGAAGTIGGVVLAGVLAVGKAQGWW